MRVPDVLAICPDIILVPQRPDLIRRAHLTLLSEIESEIPIDVVKSIADLACTLDQNTSADPRTLAHRIKRRLRENVGDQITCSIGIAANRLLAKIACKVDKPNGITIWHPADMPAPLLQRPLSDIPGVGSRMSARLAEQNITSIEALLTTRPRQLRALWGNVNGERMWYALHGYTIQAEPTQRSVYGHGRVLPPEWRTIPMARDCSRLLLVKAARRMRRDSFAAQQLALWINGFKDGWGGSTPLESVHDVVPFNPAGALYIPAGKQSEMKRVMSREEVKLALTVLDLRQRLIFRLAVFDGMRPGEIFAIRLGKIGENQVLVDQRVYNGKLDTPKGRKGKNTSRRVALSPGTMEDVKAWTSFLSDRSPEAFLFPSETGKTPLRADNLWKRHFDPRLETVGLDWVNFQVFRRTNASLSRKASVDDKVSADQRGHGLGVSLGVYAVSDIQQKLDAVRRLEAEVLGAPETGDLALTQ
jgi:integrase